MTPPFEPIAQAIAQHDTFMISAHVGPDGDAIGSALALRLALEAMGKTAWVVSTDPVPTSCRFLPHISEIYQSPPHNPQCVFVIDCDGTPDRVAAPFAPIENAAQRILIDHHQTARPIFDINWIDSQQPATAQMIFELLQWLHIALTPEIANCLLCGLSTDTGNFRFPNTTATSLRMAATLVEAGADLPLIAFKLFDEKSLAATRLLGVAIDKMQSESDGQLMWTALSADDFRRAHVGDEGSENVVNVLRFVRGARMAIALRERTDETGSVTRISVRSEAELRADLFCAQFGGGGHAAAAGCRIRYQPFEKNVQTIVEAGRQWLASPRAGSDN